MSAPPRPLFIGLLVTLAIAGGWFVLLKPPGKGADSNSAFNTPISKAQQAVVQSQVAAAKAQQAGDTAPAATPKPPASLAAPKAVHAAPVKPVVTHPAVTHPAVKHAAVVHHHHATRPELAAWDHSGKILSALAQHRVAVVLFWTAGGADDNSVRRAVESVSGHAHVSTFVIPMKDVGKYEAITTGAQIELSPTVLVIGPSHRFIPIVGYTNATAIVQDIAAVR